MSVDGKTALPDGRQLRISCDEDIRRMYELRNSSDAVLVGINTILSDDPKLTVKETYVKNPRQPLRIVLDSTCRTPDTAQVLTEAARTLIVTTKGHMRTFSGPHVEVMSCPPDARGDVDLMCMVQMLADRGIKKLMVEGGGTILWSFLRNKLMDDMYVYVAPCVIGGTTTPTLVQGAGISQESEVILLKLRSVQSLGPGLLLQYTLP